MLTKSKSVTTIDLETLKPGDLIPQEALATPGEVLREEFLEPMGITAYRLAKEIGVPPPYISKVLHGGGISPDLGALLDHYFGLSAGWWSRLQANYESRRARLKLVDRIARIQPRGAHADTDPVTPTA